MLKRLTVYAIQKAMEHLLPGITDRQDKTDDKLNQALKEIVNILVIVGRFSEEYSAAQEEIKVVLKAQQAINQRLLRKIEDITFALNKQEIVIKEEILH